MRIECHVPITLRIVGVPTDDQLEAAGRALTRAVAARLTEAERLLADRHGRDCGTPVDVKEPYDADRQGAEGYAVPSFGDGGKPIEVPDRQGTSAPAGAEPTRTGAAEPAAPPAAEPVAAPAAEPVAAPVAEAVAAPAAETVATPAAEATAVRPSPKSGVSAWTRAWAVRFGLDRAMSGVDQAVPAPRVAASSAAPTEEGTPPAPHGPSTTTPAPAQETHAAHHDHDPAPVDTAPLHPDARAFLDDKLRKFYELIGTRERIRLKRNSTVAIGLVTLDGDPRLVYTIAANRGSKKLFQAAEQLDLVWWTYDTGVEGRGAVGAPNDAEQLMIEFARDHHATVHGMAVSRRLCADCASVVTVTARDGTTRTRYSVSVVPDPIPIPRKAAPKSRPEATTKPKPEAAAVAEAGPHAGPDVTAEARPEVGPQSEPAAGPGTPAGARPEARPGTTAPASPEVRSGATIEMRGAPVEPIHSPANLDVKSAAEGAATMLLALQLGSLRGAEEQKARAAYEELFAREIGPGLARGNSVGVTVVYEVPDQVDIAAHVAGIGDTGQVVLFRKMYVSGEAPYDPEKPPPTASTPASMYENLAPSLTNEPWYVSEGRKENQPTKGFHFKEYYFSVQPPDRRGKPLQGPRRGGTYRPQGYVLVRGRAEDVELRGMGRLLYVPPAGHESVEMWDVNGTQYDSPSVVLPGEFPHRWISGVGTDKAYSLGSRMEYGGPDKWMIIEDVTGEDLGPARRAGSTWRARIVWTRS
ncbi:hypothetical protein ACIQVK_39325 [Streptomyces sp. NPDC090493]|uniref:hypothetical protein n=1 Tax=Streptomyces sp. NPDC090493 TaxID=3365964 RepID=UPI0037F5E68B